MQLNLVIICNVYAVYSRKKHVYNGIEESKSINILNWIDTHIFFFQNIYSQPYYIRELFYFYNLYPMRIHYMLGNNSEKLSTNI